MPYFRVITYKIEGDGRSLSPHPTRLDRLALSREALLEQLDRERYVVASIDEQPHAELKTSRFNEQKILLYSTLAQFLRNPTVERKDYAELIGSLFYKSKNQKTNIITFASMRQKEFYNHVIGFLKSLGETRVPEAMRAFPQIFEQYETHLIHIAEQVAGEADMFVNLARMLDHEMEVVRYQRNSLITPLFVLFGIVLLLGVTFFWLVPRFARAIIGSPVIAPSAAAIEQKLGLILGTEYLFHQWLVQPVHAAIALVMLALMGVGTVALFRRLPSLAFIWERDLLPLTRSYGRIFRSIEETRILSSVILVLRSAELDLLYDTMISTARTAYSRYVLDRANARRNEYRADTTAEPLRNTQPVLSAVTIEMLIAGYKAQTVEGMIGAAEQRVEYNRKYVGEQIYVFQQEFQGFVTVLLAAIVGAIILTTVFPYFSHIANIAGGG